MGGPTNRVRIESERLASELAAAAEAAFARAGLIKKYFCLHGFNFVLRFAGQELADQMSRALEHLAVSPAEQVALTIDCWDRASTGVACPMPQWPAAYFAARGEIRGLDGEGMRIAYFAWLKLLNVYFPQSGRAYYCLSTARPFPLQQLGSPALTIFSWWFATLGWQLTHAAVIGTTEGGVLIGGHGGAGKSTLAFSTLGRLLRYLSDDYCVLIPGTPPLAAALYNSGKLSETSLDLLPHLRKCAANGHEVGREKAVFFLHEQFPRQQLLHTPLRAIVLSELNEQETSLEPIAPTKVREIIARSTLIQLAGSAQFDLVRLIKLIHPLPTYRLRHGTHFTDTHQALLRLCES
jgi:hypothetical protein